MEQLKVYSQMEVFSSIQMYLKWGTGVFPGR